MLKKEELPDCPVATTVQLIGNKWKTADPAQPADASVAF